MRAGVEPAQDSFSILPVTAYVKSLFSEWTLRLSVLPTEHTAHHAPIIWLSTQSQIDRWRIELHTVCIPTSVLCVINTRPLSGLMISALPFSLLSTIFTLNHFTLRFRYCVVHGETGRIRPSCLYIPRSVERWLINIAYSDILCDHVPDFNIDGFNVFSLTS